MSIISSFKFKTKNIPEVTPPATPPVAKGHSSGRKAQPVDQIAFDNAIATINTRLDNSNLLMRAVILALGICFLSLFYGYWQFASTSYNDYSQRVKELNDQRYLFQQGQIDFLMKIGTMSANNK